MSKNPFWSSPTYTIIKAMNLTGNQEGVIAQWVGKAAQWAERHPGPDAEALKAWLPHWRNRPFYTAAELAPLFPALAIALALTSRWQEPKHPTRLRNELIMGDLPRLKNSDGTLDFIVNGRYHEFFIVEQIGRWKLRELSQTEFEQECGK